jgi:hypothetical protein
MNTSGSRPRPQPAATPPDLQIPAAFPPPTPPPLDTPGRPGSIRAHLPLPLVARGVRDDNAGNRGHRRLRPVKGTQRTGVLHASGFPGRNRPRRETDLVTVAKLLVRVVLGLVRAFFGCQHVPVPPWLDGDIHSVDPNGQLVAVANEDRHCPEGRVLFHRHGRAGPGADLAHLHPQPVLAQGPELDERKREGQTGQERADRRNDRPDHGITVVGLATARRLSWCETCMPFRLSGSGPGLRAIRTSIPCRCAASPFASARTCDALPVHILRDSAALVMPRSAMPLSAMTGAVRTPPSARAVRAPGSTRIRFIADRSMSVFILIQLA